MHGPSSAPDVDAALETAVSRAIFLHPGDTRVRVDNDGRVAVGIDDLARTVIGDLWAVNLPANDARRWSLFVFAITLVG